MKTALVMMSLLMLVSCGKNNSSGGSKGPINTFANSQLRAMGLDANGSGVAFWQEGNRLTLNCEGQAMVSNQARFNYLEKVKAFTYQHPTAQFTFSSRVLNANQMYVFAQTASQKLQKSFHASSPCTENFELASY